MNTFQEYREIINKKLEQLFEKKVPINLWESMKYSVLAGGKRLRPIIILEVCNSLCGKFEHAIPTACAVEILHTYSLIHDDLPCMDNDDYRRGKLTNHKVYGEAIALLAGDAMLSYAPQIIIEQTPKDVSAQDVLKILREFFIACGPEGIVAGQVVDIESEGKNIDKETLNYIHRYKTGELFRLCFKVGGILAKADEKVLKELEKLALDIGLAFQIADDILDVVSTREKLGKTPHKDEESNKATYVTFFGLDESRKKLKELCEQAKEKLKKININSSLLIELIDKIYKQTEE